MGRQRIGQDRDFLLKTRGLLILKVPKPAPRHEGTFKWILHPTAAHDDLQDATWYCDGSLMHGTCKPYRATGFGVVVVSRDGDLGIQDRADPAEGLRQKK